jgi:hypothetical protein
MPHRDPSALLKMISAIEILLSLITGIVFLGWLLFASGREIRADRA